MAIDFTTAPGGLGRRWGQFFGRVRDCNAFLAAGDLSAGGLLSLGVGVNNVRGQFNSTLQFVVDTLYQQRDAARSGLDGFKQSVADYSVNTTIEQVDADVTLTVDKRNLTGAMQEAISQMAGSGTIYAPDYYVVPNVTAAGTPAAATNPANTGTGVMIASRVRPDGRASEHVYAETIEALCSQDAQAGGGANSGATARSESFSVKGETPASSLLAWDWPKGSGATTTLTVIDCDQNASGGNLLYGSNFATFTTANQPDFWGAPLVGACGTDIFSEASVVYRVGGKGLKFTGQASPVLSSIAQTFGATSVAAGTSGTTSTLKPSTTYAFNCFVKDSGAGLLAGVLKISLIDGSNAVINDDAATPNSATVAYSVTTGTYAAFNGFFRTPKLLPTVQKLRVSISTALTSGESMYVADLALTELPEPFYVGGPFLAIFAGATNFIYGDKITCATTNDRAGDVQTYAWRCFNMPALGGNAAQGLQLPSTSGGTAIPNAYVA